jgi:hypothetical protein
VLFPIARGTASDSAVCTWGAGAGAGAGAGVGAGVGAGAGCCCVFVGVGGFETIVEDFEDGLVVGWEAVDKAVAVFAARRGTKG